MKNILFTLSILWLLYFNELHSQQMHFYSDTLKKLTPVSTGQVINQGVHSYISNTSGDGSGSSVVTIIKVDTAGKTIWTSYPTNFIESGIEIVNIAFSQFVLGSDNNLYSWMANYGKLAKIRASNGSVDWIVPLQPVVGSPAMLVDYDLQSVVFANTKVNVNTVRLIRYSKSKGQNLGYVDLNCPGQGVFGIHIGANGNIYLASRDSCYKYTSFDNPTFEWKVRMCTGSDRYLNVHKLAQDGNNLFIFGNKETGFHNGMISCIDMTNGSLKWFSKNGGSYDFYYADHKVKNGSLYTSWKHLYVGSIPERCFINKININTGVKNWEFNHPFRTQVVNVSKEEAMVSMDIDENETLFLTGYGLPDNHTAVSWGFMKIRGSDGMVLKRSFISASGYDYPSSFTARLVGNRVYTTGLMPGSLAGGSVDTAGLTPGKTNLYKSAIQFTSSVIGIQNVSLNKKVIFKKIGKSLRVEMIDPYFNTLWEKSLGDTLYPYEGVDLIGTDSAGIIYIPFHKYPYASNNHFYFSQVPNPDSFYIFGFDSIGKIVHQYSRVVGSKLYPYQFFRDSLNRTWYDYFSGTSVNAFLYPIGSVPGASGVSGTSAPKSYKLLKPVNYFGYSKDTILLFSDPVSLTRGATLRKTWEGYSATAKSYYWFWRPLSIRWIHSAEREDKNNYYVVGKDSSYRDLVFKYRISDSTIVWSKKFDTSLITLKGYELNKSFYALSTQGQNVLIRKINGNDGNISWTKTINPPIGHIFKIGDYAMSKERENITIAGYLVDTLISAMSKLYIVSFDTAGNEIHSYLSEGYGSWQNKGTSITIGQDGQTLVSGQITDSAYGYAGFIYEVDASSLIAPLPEPQIKDIAASACSDTTQKKAKLLNPVLAPNLISIVMDNAVSLPFNWTDSSFNYSVANAGNHTIRVTYSYKSNSSFKDTSFVVKTTPAAGSAPVQNGNVLNAPATGDSYQWYLNAVTIAGSTNQTISINQNGNYSYTYSINGCTSPESPAISALFTSIIDPTNNNAIITFFPNPTSGPVVIKNVNSSYRYKIRVIDHNGKQVKDLITAAGNNSVEIDLSNLQSGTYILQLWNLSKKVLIGNQQIILAK